MPSHARRHQLQQSLVYHAFSRSSGRREIFHNPRDFAYFKKLIKDYTDKFGISVYHWVIMPNHYHLVLELDVPESISGFMAGLHRAYSHYYCRRYDTVGFLWQGRFKLQPVQKEAYLKNCGRYVERNPVRSGFVKEACEYNYGSARFYCLGEEDGITKMSPYFDEFGNNIRARQVAYKEFLSVLDRGDEDRFSGAGIICGDKVFIGKLVKMNGHYFPRRNGRRRLSGES
ncbi:MAG: transposase [Candidatus Omnitrophota bacterium]